MRILLIIATVELRQTKNQKHYNLYYYCIKTVFLIYLLCTDTMQTYSCTFGPYLNGFEYKK